MAHYTLIARINTGNGKFPFVKVQFSKNHRPIPMEGATYYLRPGGGKRTPIKIGKDVAVAHTALVQMEDGKPLNNIAVPATARSSIIPAAAPRKTVPEAAREYIERSRQKSHKIPRQRRSFLRAVAYVTAPFMQGLPPATADLLGAEPYIYSSECKNRGNTFEI